MEVTLSTNIFASVTMEGITILATRSCTWDAENRVCTTHQHTWTDCLSFVRNQTEQVESEWSPQTTNQRSATQSDDDDFEFIISDVSDDEFEVLVPDYGDQKTTHQVVEHKATIVLEHNNTHNRTSDSTNATNVTVHHIDTIVDELGIRRFVLKTKNGTRAHDPRAILIASMLDLTHQACMHHGRDNARSFRLGSKLVGFGSH